MPLINYSSLKISKNLVYIVLFILIGSMLSFIYLKPFLGFKDTMFLRLDWHHDFQLTGATWITLVKYKEFPFWNPYKDGGNYLFAHPQSFLLSPETLFVLIFGPIKGLYYSVFFFYVLGFVGCYFVGKYFRLSFLATLYLAVIFTFQSHVMNYLFIGASTWMMMGYIPFAFYFLLKSRHNWRYGVAAGFFHALIYLGGSTYIFMLFILFAIIFVVSNVVANRDLKFIKGPAVMLIFSFLFASIKIVPGLDLYEVNKRVVGFDDLLPLKLEVLKKTFLDKNQAWDIVSVYWINGLNFHWPHYGDYIGIVPILLAIIGMILGVKNLDLVLITFGSLLIFLSNYEHFSFIWKIIHYIPAFNALQHPARFVIFVVLMLSIFGAKLISKLDRLKISNKTSSHLKSVLIIALIVFVFVDLTKASYIITDNFKPWPMQKEFIKWDDKFEYYDFYERFNLSEEQIALLDANYFKSFEHFDTLSNKGVNKRALENIRLFGGTILSKGDPGYKGEYYFIESNDSLIQLEKWSPNKIMLKVKADKDDILIINQNFQKNWKVVEGFDVLDYKGLLGIRIPRGEHVVSIYVFQNRILIGAFLFLIGVIFGAYLLITIKK